MKKIFTILGLVSVSAIMTAQTAFTATYDFVEAPAPDNGTVVGSNLTVTPFTATGLISTTTGNRFAWSGTTTAATLDLGRYFEVTVAPTSGFNITVSSISFRSQRSGTGPRYYAVRSNADSYAANLPASISPANAELEVVGNAFHWVNDGVTMGQNGNLVTISNSANVSSPVTFRIYFYEAEAESGTFSVDDVVISGTTQNSLGVSNSFSTKVNLVKNTNVNNTVVFGAKANVQIVNANGQVVKTAAVNENTALDVSSLSKGVYIITADVNGEKVSQKIIKN